MLNRSTMMSLAAGAVLVRAADYTAGAGLYSGEEQSKQYFSEATPLTGNYKLVSRTGLTLTYTHANTNNLFPTDSPLESIISDIEAAFDDTTASQTFNLKAIDDNSVIIMAENNGDPKCGAAQWSDEYGVDLYFVAYACPGVDSDTDLRLAKTYYLFIEQESSSESSSSSSSSSSSGSGSGSQDASGTGSSDSGSGLGDSSPASSKTPTSSSSAAAASSTSTCEKSPEWVWAHAYESHKAFYEVHPDCIGTGVAPPCLHDHAWLHEHPAYMDDNAHPECNSEWAKRSETRSLEHGQRMARAPHHARLAKRAAGSFMVAAVDHLGDMQARCLTAVKTTSFGDADSTILSLCEKGNDAQVWDVYEA